MSCSVTQESFSSLLELRDKYDTHLDWEPLFISPVWLEVWWSVFGNDRELYLTSVREGDTVIGVAPLMIENGISSFIGSADVCDYLDFVVTQDRGQDFFDTLIDNLKRKEVKQLSLESLRPDSKVLTGLTDVALRRGCEVTLAPCGVTLEMALPDTWDDYLMTLNSKQRHEVRRKLRRLEEAGNFEYRSISGAASVLESLDIFLKMFKESRDDKADFLTEKRELFFRSMTESMANAGVLKLGVLGIEKNPAAMIMYFDYNDKIYLYNSGFEKEYISLSVGLLSKVLCIKDSIESGKKVFDFLKGNEVYKSRLGGIERQLSDCSISIN
ncbi:MAG: GNAT family N-acetyltransferase [Dehalococcoidales bacterium]|nr:MAG: GNAT family N-acetyltransferase [Dehalococcoidales bacterium]